MNLILNSKVMNRKIDKTLILFAVGGILMVLLPSVSAFGMDIGGAFTEIRQNFRELKESIEGIGRFITALHGIIGAVTSVIDPAALLLLMVVLVFSAGFSSIGIPRGKASFAVSLIAVDLIWFLWKRSMNPGSLAYLPGMLIANLYIIVPYLSFVFICKVLRKHVSAGGYALSKSIRKHVFRRGVDKSDALLLTDKLRGSSAAAVNSLERDLERDDGRADLSQGTRELLAELAKNLDKIRAL